MNDDRAQRTRYIQALISSALAFNYIYPQSQRFSSVSFVASKWDEQKSQDPTFENPCGCSQ
jgi:hypothetical protein